MLILIAFIAEQPDVRASSLIRETKPALQQPTIFSGWGIAGDEHKALLAYIDLYLKDIEREGSNHNITRMGRAIREVLVGFNADQVIPLGIKENIPGQVETEGDRAIRINFGGEVLIRYYNPMINGAEIPYLKEEHGEYDINEVALAGPKKPEAQYLCKQILLLRNNKKNLWYNRKVADFIDKGPVKLNLEKISESADLVIPFFLDGSQLGYHSIWNPMFKMKDLAKELKQSREEIAIYIEALRVFDELISLDEVDAEIFERYLRVFYDHLRNYGKQNNTRSGGSPDLAEVKKIIKELFSEDTASLIAKDPVRYAAVAFNRILTVHEFDDYNHRVSSFVLNYVLVKNGYPYFYIKPSNIEEYYRKLAIRIFDDGEPGVDGMAEFLKKELGQDPLNKKNHGILSPRQAEAKGFFWYNRFVHARFPPDETRDRIASLIKMSGEITEHVFSGRLMRKIPETGDNDLDKEVINRLKNMFRREIESIDLENHERSMNVFYAMLEDRDLTLDKMEAYIRDFQKNNVGDGKSGYRDDRGYAQKEFREILGKLFSTRGYGEIEADIFFFASVIFTEIVRLQPFENGNHRVADLVMNFILMKNGYSAFTLTEENVIRYYELFNSPALEEGDFNMFEIAQFFRTEIKKNKAVRVLTAWHNIPADKDQDTLARNVVKNVIGSILRIPPDYVKGLFLADYPAMAKKQYARGLRAFSRAVKDDDLNAVKLIRYIAEFYKALHPHQYEIYRDYYKLAGGSKCSHNYQIVRNVIERAFDGENTELISRDPVAFAVKILHAVISSGFLIKGLHEVGLFVLNLILAKNRFPYFFITGSNAAKYYDMCSRRSIRERKYSLAEMIFFFKREIENNYQRQRTFNKLSFRQTLYVDPEEKKVRRLGKKPGGAAKLSEEKALNRAVERIVLGNKHTSLGPDDPLVRFLRKVDNAASEKVRVYVLAEEELKEELGDLAHIADGLITHARGNDVRGYDIFIPGYIYGQMASVLGEKHVNKDIDHVYSLWGHHVLELPGQRSQTDTDQPGDVEREALMRIWMFSKAKREYVSAIDIKDRKTKLKKLRSAGNLLEMSSGSDPEPFFLNELKGDIFFEVAKNTNNDRDFYRSLEAYTTALSTLVEQQGKIPEEQALALKPLEVLESWSGKTSAGSMPKKAKRRLHQAIEHIADPVFYKKLNPEIIKRYGHLIKEQLDTESQDDPFFARFSMIPMVLQYLGRYQKKEPDTGIIRNLLFILKEEISEGDKPLERKKAWDELRVKAYHFCGKSFMDKTGVNFLIDAENCFRNELKCEQPYVEAYALLAETILRADRSRKAIEEARKIMLDGSKRFGQMELWEKAGSEIDGIERENRSIFDALKKNFDTGEYDECVSEFKKVAKIYYRI